MSGPGSEFLFRERFEELRAHYEIGKLSRTAPTVLSERHEPRIWPAGHAKDDLSPLRTLSRSLDK